MEKSGHAFEGGNTVDKYIEDFIKNIPNPNREEAIKGARQKKEQFILNIWQRERGKLDGGFVEENNLTEDLDGWDKYLLAVYNTESEYRKNKYQYEEWAVKYLFDMLSNLEEDAYNVAAHEEQGKLSREDLLEVPGCYFEKHKKDGIFGYTTGRGMFVLPDSDSLMVHSISEKSLQKVIQSGVVGAGGVASCALSQDRIIYDDGYLIVFQAKDLIAAGYPLLQINEDPRDAKILKEWRTPMPIDINLARLIAATEIVPDKEKVANQAQIAHTFLEMSF